MNYYFVPTSSLWPILFKLVFSSHRKRLQSQLHENLFLLVVLFVAARLLQHLFSSTAEDPERPRSVSSSATGQGRRRPLLRSWDRWLIDAMVKDGAIETRPGDDDPGAIALMHRLAENSRKRWPEWASGEARVGIG